MNDFHDGGHLSRKRPVPSQRGRRRRPGHRRAKEPEHRGAPTTRKFGGRNGLWHNKNWLTDLLETSNLRCRRARVARSLARRASVEIQERTRRPGQRSVHPIGAYVAVKHPMDDSTLARLAPNLIHARPEWMPVSATLRRPRFHPAPARAPQPLDIAHTFELFAM